MRMALCWPSLILLLCALPIYASATNYTLTSELTNFIPSCAQTCFESFLNENFPANLCSTTPTLDCLCSHNTTSGYTVGEGAVQCIISEDNIGFCQGNDAKEDVAISAFNMCVGQVNALPNTHSTITATLIVETSMPSIVLIAPAVTTTSSLVSSSLSMTQTTGSSLSPLSSATGSPSKSGRASSTALVTASETAAAAAPATNLTKKQIVGITVASVGAGSAGIAALLIFICLRRRKQRKARESDLLPFQLDPPSHLMDKNNYKYKGFKGPAERKPGGTRNGLAAKVAPPIPPRLDTSSPNMFSRRSIRPDTIGLAISPESHSAMEKKQRRSSKLLPEKPNLTLKMPQSPPRGGLSFSQSVPGTVRESVATRFEEDEFDSADTAVNADDSWGQKSSDKILDNAAGSWQTVKLVEPEPPKPAAFVDGGREYHWRPPQASSNISASPDLFVKPLNLSRGRGSFSQPRRPERKSRAQEQLQLAIPTQVARPINTTSSVYSTRGSVPGSDEAGRSAPHSGKSYRQSGPYDIRQSEGSLTSFDSLDSGFSPDGTEPRTAGMDLSPVVESPTSTGGISPVTYPKIPVRLSASTIPMIPPPPQPDFTKTVGGARVAPAGKPWRQAELAAQKERERISRQSQEQTQAATRELQAQVGMQNFNPGHRRQRSSASKNVYTFPAPSARSQTTPPVQSQPQTQRDTEALVNSTGGFGHNSRVNQLSTHPNITFTRSSSALSQYSQASKNSTSSSLLAKRLGEQKAASLALRGEDEKKGPNPKWRVLRKEEIEMAKQKGWRPMLSSAGGGGKKDSPRQRGANSAGGGSGRGGGDMEEPLDTPTTPGWVGLTPTRRGDELFLSVQ